MTHLLDSEAGKRRLLTVEVPVIERYNDGRDADFKIRLVRQGSALVLRYRLKPMHNVYEVETRLLSSYPLVPPETRLRNGQIFSKRLAVRLLCQSGGERRNGTVRLIQSQPGLRENLLDRR